ncbi:hypothetical protein EJ02DRAFT_362398 [Clathrospora elynae]|uniref:HTH CENPB-type domain-containing protein n=1 Tax=Clathrospora elynae TaxID=706981 RepID=A0A6A5S531_9PLEO|nr:hypothetical protein EJ02DRAFT_362398 [Clathrospora elynae]
MALIEAVLAAIESLEPGEKFTYQQIAAAHGVNQSTLSRRHKQSHVLHEAKSINQQKLNPQQELELVEYIKMLTKRGLPPTREMVQNFASCVAKEPVGEGWVTRFINRMKDYLTSQ